MKLLTLISRILVGLLFTFSGLTKAVDPLGSTYKFADYFNALGMSWMAPLAFVLAIVMISMEFLVGLTLLCNVKVRLGSIGALIFMAFFTPLTLYLAIKNPVHDCGCFGDFLIISNWETFFKNIVISILVLILFLNRNKIEYAYSNKVELGMLSGFVLLILGFQLFCMTYYISAFDFRPYKVGVNIPDKMKIPENAEKDVYQTLLYYEKDGVVKEFTDKNFPWQDSTWKWKETKNVLIKEGYKPPIHDFSIKNLILNENDTVQASEITDMVLNDDKVSFLFVAYDLTKSSIGGFQKAKTLIDYCKANNYKFYTLTASSPKEAKELQTKIGFELDFYTTDGTALKTVIRSNTGLLMLKKGTIIGKWHHSDIPKLEKMIEKINSFK